MLDLEKARADAEKYLLTSDYMGKEYKRTVLDAYRDALIAAVRMEVKNA